MAQKTTETINFTTRGESKYDWDNWFDGDTWILTQGEDFEISVDSFQTMCHIRSRKRGLKIQTKRVNKSSIAIKSNAIPPVKIVETEETDEEINEETNEETE